MTSFGVRLLVPWLILVATATLGPFNFGAASLDGGFFGTSESHQDDPVHVLLNVLLFVPLGAFVHHDGHRRSRKFVSIILLAGAAALVISLFFESLQRFLPGRESSLMDLAANTAGALTGVLGARTWGASVAARLHRLRTRISAPMLVGLLAGLTVVTLVCSSALQARTRLSNWNATYPLLIGNENTADRPWRGRVLALELTDAATPESIVRRFGDGGSLMLRGVPVAAFDLRGTPPYNDATGNLPHLESRGTLPNPPWFGTSGPAAALVYRLRESNAFALRLLLESDDVHQTGPARIVSNSRNAAFRNFTIGQEEDALVVRLRTPSTGLNGVRAEVLVPGVFTGAGTRDILVTYDGATVLATAARLGRVSRFALTPGFVLGASATSQDQEIDTTLLPIWQILYLAFLFTGPGVLLGVLGHTISNRNAFGLLWISLFALLHESTLMLTSGRTFDWSNVAITFAVGVLTVSWMVMTFSVPGTRAAGGPAEPWPGDARHPFPEPSSSVS